MFMFLYTHTHTQTHSEKGTIVFWHFKINCHGPKEAAYYGGLITENESA
jgi:hypothetical protein